ncbi:PepSY domain-containing protein [Thauera chlorobenzoica]|uniref:PepSY domain-containing protein n=1 Tax=Thauera chlorobenzoica TaxID=96773 RepID=A0A1H5VDF9_9RHOO|nr:PepSY domain-containing protein [Thauera chlorobenzoica]APR06236.1 hypothetical protein Tchl_3436 [Thauera chlorobenzoica]SEF85116.1 Peptidase propeptide and YPEB domain-containing protein [Thauera chlorobenzoica]
MRATTLITTLLLGAGILAGGAVLIPALAQNGTGSAIGISAATGQDGWLTLHEVQLKLEALGYRELTKIERDDDKYEVKAIDAQGQRVELDVDPLTGAILGTEVKRSKGSRSDTEQASWLTLHQVQVKLEATGYRDIQEIERERDHYQAKATDAQGQRVKLAIDPRSGDVLDTDVKRSRGDDRRSADEPRTRLTVDPYSGDVIEGTAAERATNPTAPATK